MGTRLATAGILALTLLLAPALAGAKTKESFKDTGVASKNNKSPVAVVSVDIENPGRLNFKITPKGGKGARKNGVYDFNFVVHCIDADGNRATFPDFDQKDKTRKGVFRRGLPLPEGGPWVRCRVEVAAKLKSGARKITVKVVHVREE